MVFFLLKCVSLGKLPVSKPESAYCRANMRTPAHARVCVLQHWLSSLVLLHVKYSLLDRWSLFNRELNPVLQVANANPANVLRFARAALVRGQHMSVLAQTHNQQMCYSNQGTNRSSKMCFILFLKLVFLRLTGWEVFMWEVLTSGCNDSLWE